MQKNDAPNTSASDNTNDNRVEKISIKPPPFWKTNPIVWFCQIEAQFAAQGVTRESSKYNYAVAAIDSEVLNQVCDILINPPENDRYKVLKARLLERYSDSETTRFKKLLNDLELGDKRPSHLLTEMRALANSSMTDDVLRSLWLQRLPNQMQAILAISSEPTDKLASMADKICEATSTTNVFQISKPIKNEISTSTEAILLKKIDELTCRLNEMSTRSDYQPHSRSRANSRYRNRSASRSHSRPHRNSNSRAATPQVSVVCWYHRKYGGNATKCTRPCSYGNNNTTTTPSVPENQQAR